jgi:hypothetical protein
MAVANAPTYSDTATITAVKSLIYRVNYSKNVYWRNQTSGLYYKHITIVNYDSIVVKKFEASFTDDTRFVIYDRHMFIKQATSCSKLVSSSMSVTSYLVYLQASLGASSKSGAP